MRNLATPWILIGLVGAGCATTGTSKDGGEAGVKSKAYLEDVTLVAAPEAKKVGCKMPTGADKSLPGVDEAPSKDWRVLVAHANACVADQQWNLVEKIAETIARNDINSPWGAYFHSLVADARGDWGRALWMADLAQKKTGGRSGLYLYQKGRVLLRMKETTRAMAEIQKAVTIEPGLVDGHLFLAEIHHRDAEPDKAVEHFTAVLAAQPKSYRALTGLAEVRLGQGKTDAAVDLYSKAVSAHPDQLRPWMRLAFIYETVQKNGSLALDTYKGLKSSIDKGSLTERPGIDLNLKIQTLEESLKPARVPAQAATAAADVQTANDSGQKRSAK